MFDKRVAPLTSYDAGKWRTDENIGLMVTFTKVMFAVDIESLPLLFLVTQILETAVNILFKCSEQ